MTSISLVEVVQCPEKSPSQTSAQPDSGPVQRNWPRRIQSARQHLRKSQTALSPCDPVERRPGRPSGERGLSPLPLARSSSARPASAPAGTSPHPARSTSGPVPATPDRSGRTPRGRRAAESAESRSPAGCVEHHRTVLAPATTRPAKRTATANVRLACSPCEPDDMVGVFIVGWFIPSREPGPRPRTRCA